MACKHNKTIITYNRAGKRWYVLCQNEPSRNVCGMMSGLPSTWEISGVIAW